MLEEITKAVNKLRSESQKKNFKQSVDLVVSLKGVDLKKPDTKFTEDIILPHGRGTEANIVVFSDNAGHLDAEIMTNADVQRIAANRKETRKLASETDFFLAEAPMMPVIGKTLGQVLAPRNKMPKILAGDPNAMIKNYKRSIRVALRNSPVIQSYIGKEDMDDKQLAENVEAVLKFLENKLPRGRQNIGKVLLKLTMGKPVKIEVK